MSAEPVLAPIAEAICNSKGYVRGEMVGEGAFKQTFIVTDADGHEHALKVFRRAGASPRTEREFAAMMTCDHPHIAKLVEINRIEVGGRPFIYSVEDYLSGGTLAKRLEGGLFDRSDLLSLGSDLISAVSHIASHSLVHRDIKPENILFRSDGRTSVVVDFGIVRDLVRSPLTKSWVLQGPGTPYFASPEQLNNDREMIDWRADQFALGVTLFLTRFGYHPYGGPRQAPDEVIAHVAERRGPSHEALSSMETDRLPALAGMIGAWPVERFRRPSDLERAWAELED